MVSYLQEKKIETAVVNRLQNNPVVSVVTPSFNSENEILECYQTLKNQTISNWEWLVTDDASSDSTPAILADIAAKDARVRPEIMARNRGPGPCRNDSMDRAIGKFLAFLDSDDLWHPEKLEMQLETHTTSGATFTFTSFMAFRGDLVGRGPVIDPGPQRYFSYDDMLHKRATLGCSTVMLDRQAVGAQRMPNIRSGQDYAFWLSILKNGNKALLISTPLMYYRIRPGSVSRNKFKKAARQWEIYRVVEGLPFFRSVGCYFSYVKNALLR
jgi:teichuronic acid biosynthesis glycosyltransferase TuaG